MTSKEIQTALAELVAAMVERGVCIPKADFTVWPDKMRIYLKTYEVDHRPFRGQNFSFCDGDTPEECFDAAWAVINALPSSEEAVTREYLTRVASAIDYATENSIADEYVTPLRGVTCAMTSNLLTKDQTQ